jgi:DNA-directed RNA polymerase subunit RPC12/RpoP
MKEIICSKCGKGTGIFRHDNHLIHKLNFMECKDCGKVDEKKKGDFSE